MEVSSFILVLNVLGLMLIPEFSPAGIRSLMEDSCFSALTAPIVARRIIDKIVRTQDLRIVPILEDFLKKFHDVSVRVRSIEAFHELRVTRALPLLYRLQKEAPEIRIQRDLQQAIQGMALRQ